MSKNTINFKKILIWGAPTAAITAVMFILYRVLLNNFRFDAVLTVYMAVTTALLLGYLIYNGKIFTEAYWKPFNKDFCHRQYSQTKSFVGIAIGLLVSEGKLSLDDKIADLFPEKADDPTAVPLRLKTQTVRQMLTMTTVGDRRCWFDYADSDRTHFYFNNRTEMKIPGALWEYDSPGSQVL